MKFRGLLLILFLALPGADLIAQKFGSMKGLVRFNESGEPMSEASVVLEGTQIGTRTDNAGYYSITRIPVGSYTLRVSYVGYETQTKKVTIEEGKMTSVDFSLVNMRELTGVTISDNKRENLRNNVSVSTVTLTNEDIRKVPTVGGEPELMQTLMVQPGVVSSGDQGGQLYIRGGPPIQNKVLMDGAIIFNPFHSIGLFSVFDADLIHSADIYTGGFGGQYGGRISSIMDITTRDGNKKRFAGKVGITPFTAKVLLEGPFKKLKEDGGSSASYMLSARGSYLEYTSKIFYPYTRDTNGLPYNFWDIYGKISVNAGSQGSKINIFGFTHNDIVNYNAITQLKWRSIGGGLNFIVVPGQANVRIDGVVSYSNYKIDMVEQNELDLQRYSIVNGFNFGINFHQYLGSDRITYGLEAVTTATDLYYDTPYSTHIQNEQNTTELAAFVRGKFSRWGFVFDPSFRLHYYASFGEVSAEPRLGIKFNARPWFRLKLAGGLYSQNLIAANSDRDVVNLFYGFLAGEEDIVGTYKGEKVTSRLSRAQHGIFGMEFDIGKYVDLNIEGYYMNFSQLLNVNRNKQYDVNQAGVAEYLKSDVIVETGYAAGLDVTAKFEYKGFYIWLVYSLMKTERTDELRTYSPHFDRTHNINIVADYRFGKNKDWEVSARWNLGSGFPFTQTQGFYEFLDFQGGIGTDYTTTNGTLGIQYADVNTGRLPWYHRLDINIRKTFAFKKNLKLELNAGASNVYNRQNVFYVDRVTFKRIDQLPIMYHLGMNFAF